MSEEIKNDANKDAQPQEKIMMQIILTLDGQVKLVSPILGDKTACYGLLEVAKDLIRDSHAPKNKIMPFNGSFLNNLRNGLKK